MVDEPISWRVSCQAWDAHRIGDRKPDVLETVFKTEEQAQACKAQHQANGLVCCITPIYTSARVRTRRNQSKLRPLPKMTKALTQ